MPKNIINGRISDESIAHVDDSHVQRLLRHKVSVGDIIFSRRGDVGRCAIIHENEKGWLCGTGCLRITVDRTLAEPYFIFCYLQQQKTRRWIEQHAIGSTMLNLNTAILGNIPLSLPSIEVQRNIAREIEAYDTLTENYHQQIRLLNEASKRVFSSCMSF